MFGSAEEKVHREQQKADFGAISFKQVYICQNTSLVLPRADTPRKALFKRIHNNAQSDAGIERGRDEAREEVSAVCQWLYCTVHVYVLRFQRQCLDVIN